MHISRIAANRRKGRQGVALIITIGLLAVLTLLAVAFAIAMRVESMAARNYLNLVRSKQLIYTGLQQGMDDVTRTCVGRTYPDWKLFSSPGLTAPYPRDALSSTNTSTNVCILMVGEATNTIPPSLYANAFARTPKWKNVLVTNDGGIVQTNGRVAYLIVNTSGLLDASYIGGKPRIDSATTAEIDPSNLFVPTADASTFVSNRTVRHKRYETLQEIYGITVADPAEAPVLFPTSYDPGPDVYLQNTNQLGSASAVLIPKFNINSITNYACFWNMTTPGAYLSDPLFMANYLTPLGNILGAALPEMPDSKKIDVAWNVVNYLDPNRIPQNGNPYSYRHTEGTECVPLINEIVFDQVSGAPTYKYRFRVELWYPFIPTNVASGDGFKLQIGVFSNNFTAATAPAENVIMNSAWRRYLFNIDGMTFGTPTEFRVYDTSASPYVAFPPPKNAALPISSSNAVWFLARVLKVDTPSGGGSPVTNVVDESMGYRQSDEPGNPVQRALKKFEFAPVDYQINDPRMNGQCRYWDPTVGGYPTTTYPSGRRFGGPGSIAPYSNTLTNYNDTSFCTFFKTPKSQGYPIWFANQPMRNVAEIGHIYRTNMDDEAPYSSTALYYDWAFWRNIDLLNKKEGAKLIDMLTVRAVNRSCRGRITINTRQKKTLETLVNGLRPADTDADGAIDWGPYMGNINPVSYAWITNLVAKVQARADSLNGCKQWQDLFDSGATSAPDEPLDNGGPVAVAMRQCITGIMGSGYKTNDILQEAVGRGLIELLSFRQNIFTILIASQAVGRDGKTVVGEQRAVATVVRDSYTGKFFVRNMKWLAD
jgi:Tfp pilus assembly protein PilX